MSSNHSDVVSQPTASDLFKYARDICIQNVFIDRPESELLTDLETILNANPDKTQQTPHTITMFPLIRGMVNIYHKSHYTCRAPSIMNIFRNRNNDENLEVTYLQPQDAQ
eukprot:scaffold78621_cov46-Cyclotella_meneghiniana.AAC.1